MMRTIFTKSFPRYRHHGLHVYHRLQFPKHNSALCVSRSASSSSLSPPPPKSSAAVKPYEYQNKYLQGPLSHSRATKSKTERDAQSPWLMYFMFPLTGLAVMYLSSALWEEAVWMYEAYVGIPRRKKRLSRIREQMEREEQQQQQQRQQEEEEENSNVVIQFAIPLRK